MKNMLGQNTFVWIKIVQNLFFSHYDIFPAPTWLKVRTFLLSQVWYIAGDCLKVPIFGSLYKITTQSWGLAWVLRSKLRAQVKNTFTCLCLILNYEDLLTFPLWMQQFSDLLCFYLKVLDFALFFLVGFFRGESEVQRYW